ncbi:peptidoglycan DD-metalloendopeptidase family protein [Auraticoccus sp. F435]|uniref:Peptidoglycan DD-metalloendopeptidase family protein n=1 Tax=Auraticoccus cholistanensis TaxID=2656650 RepID=A0A6A9UUI2_9ACTN|nr:M23 family metallopeptidase [Auraticoccus cholistanensis]MVA76341.1 peptidoglycan DD-metalloendopeptidase family protein [Auraticoccus cholistanensis]
MRTRAWSTPALAALVVLAGCTGGPPADPNAAPSTTTAASPAATPTSPGPAEPSPTPSLDPDNEFWVEDDTWYRSPWYEGRGRIMIGFGCTEAPYYAPDPSCPDGQGFHHGVDVALPCGTELRSGVAGTVVDPGSRGRLGGAYGSTGFRLRDPERGLDVVLGHAETVLVTPGQEVRPGQRIGTVGDRGAPDGCHLHLEVRPAAGSVADAVDPREVLQLRE